jgi:NAD(P)-dependent dehydrogenase (short-subunit alcohol dehydrogenase family)
MSTAPERGPLTGRAIAVELARAGAAVYATGRSSPSRSWAVAPGSCQIMVGNSSARLPLRAAIQFTG